MVVVRRLSVGSTSLVLLAVAGAVWLVSDNLVRIGPLDRALIGWLIVVPLILLAPGVAAFGKPAESVISVVAVGSLVVVALSLSISQIGCSPASLPTVVLHALPVGVAASMGFVAATLAARHAASLASAGRVWIGLFTGALVAFGGGALVLLLFAAVFPPVSCPAA